MNLILKLGKSFPHSSQVEMMVFATAGKKPVNDFSRNFSEGKLMKIVNVSNWINCVSF